MGYKSHNDITKRLCGHFWEIFFSLPLVGIQARVVTVFIRLMTDWGDAAAILRVAFEIVRYPA